jgi:hypothetical protein
MNDTIQIAGSKNRKRCAVYCRVSSDERLDQEFNSIDAQKEAGTLTSPASAPRAGFRSPMTTTTPATPAATPTGRR